MKKILRKAVLLFLTLAVGISTGYLANHVFSENAKFEKFTGQIFREEVTGSTLTLHYTLAEPKKQGVTPPPVSLGSPNADMDKLYQLFEQYETRLRDFSYSRLSRENQLTLDMLLLYFHTRRSLGENYLLEEYLSPSLGIQAQLPVLLAEYSFYKEEDISDYLRLLSAVRPYFENILEFERRKSEAGFFMSDASLDRVQRQCREFIKNPDDNYMLDVFSRKIKDFGKFNDEEQKKLLAEHKRLLNEQVIPAYRSLIDGLEMLRGTGKNDKGLAWFKGGRDYYRYLIQSETGSYVPVEAIEKRLVRQLMSDYREMSALAKANPTLIPRLASMTDSIRLEPPRMLEELQRMIAADFPALENVSFEVRYVHDSMKDFSSPAFYLVPPVDLGSPNVIYLNKGKPSGSLELFGTLAHEGFPGHLYQTVSFGRTKPANIRYLINSGGYSEGWATYAESFGYGYAASLMSGENTAEGAKLAWLNRNINLCIYSLVDLGIHYRGWDEERTAGFLRAFGIRSPAAVSEIYRYVVETPANYLKYYWGYLNFLDLRKQQEKALGKDFDLKEFHRQILEIGPVPFPVLQKYMNTKKELP